MEEKLYSEMNEFLSASSEPDEGDLPFEPLDAFSTEPVEFSEMAGDMLDKVENLFDLTRLYNRHSVKYLKAFALLEKGIRFLGSACVPSGKGDPLSRQRLCYEIRHGHP